MGYINFVLQASRGRIAQVNYDAVDKFGTEGSKRYRELGVYPKLRKGSGVQSDGGSLPATQQGPQK